jgi:hypothetical protein
MNSIDVSFKIIVVLLLIFAMSATITATKVLSVHMEIINRINFINRYEINYNQSFRYDPFSLEEQTPLLKDFTFTPLQKPSYELLNRKYYE